MRPQSIRWAGALALALGLGVALPAARAAEPAQEENPAPETEQAQDAVAAGLTLDAEATASYHFVNSAYFVADPVHTTWGEGFSRLRLIWGGPEHTWAKAGGVVMGTAGTDYFGTRDAGDGMLDLLAVGISRIGDTGLSASAGRMDLVVGDGFLVGDGFTEAKAALWNIPLSFYDAGRLDWQRGPWHALAFGARLSPSLYNPTFEVGVKVKGLQGGGEVGWSRGEEAALAVGFFDKRDTGDQDLQANATSVRGSFARGPAALAGEAVLEGGRRGDVDLRGRGGHLGLTVTASHRFKPHAGVEYFYFSGDDPATPQDEAYDPWNYRWSDWSRYYVGDLLASTLLFNTDLRIWKLELGAEPREGTGVRVLLHRYDLDTGSSFGGLPESGRGFADAADLVIDQSFGEQWSAWVMGAYARPRPAAKDLVGAAASGQVFFRVSYKLSMPLSAAAD